MRRLVLLFILGIITSADLLAQSCNTYGESQFYAKCNEYENLYTTDSPLKYTKTRITETYWDLQCANNSTVPGVGNITHGVFIALSCPNTYIPPTTKTPNVKTPTTGCGSIIQTANQVVGETIPVQSAPFELVYFSNKVRGRLADYKSDIRITGPLIASTVTGYSLTIKDEVGTTLLSNSYGATTDLVHAYEWDGLNASSVETWGPIERKISMIEYSTEIPTVTSTMNFIPFSLFLGNVKVKKLGLGGWYPSIWHFYDAPSKTLYRADGTTYITTGIADGVYTRVAAENGNEVYYFDSTGRLSHTKTGLTGTTIYTFAYDGSGRLSTISQPFSKVTTFNRDGSGKLKEIVAPNGDVTDVTVDVNGYLATVTGPISEVYSMTYYGSDGLLNTFTVPSGDITTLTYDLDGNLLSDVHSNGFSVTLAKTLTSITSTSALGRVTSSVFNPYSNSETITTPSGFQDLVAYSTGTTQLTNNRWYETINYVAHPRFGSQAKRMRARDFYNFGSRSSTFENTTTLSTPTDPFAITTIVDTETIGPSINTATYTGSTRTTNYTTKLGKTRKLQIDQYERPILTKIGNMTDKVFTYVDDLLTNITQGARGIDFTYNGKGLLSSKTDSLNQTTYYAYDLANRIQTITLPDSRVVTYTYDYNGNLVSLTPPLNPASIASDFEHIFSYGTKDKLTSYAPPLLSGVSVVNTTYAYNNDKQLTKITRPDGKEINYNYNSTSGLLTSITGLFGTITKSYSQELPNLTTDQYGHSLSVSWDRSTPVSASLSKSGTSIYTFSRTPHSVGEKVKSETTNGGGSGSVPVVVNYTYNDDEDLTSTGDMTIAYNTPNGEITGTTLGSITDTYTYNSFGEIDTYVAKYSGTTIYEYSLSRDAIGRVSQKVEILNGITSTFDYVYDDAGRLIEVSTNGLVTSTYSYDQNSNRTGGLVGGVSISATYDNQDRLNNYNGTTFTYNANGELLTKGTGSYDYDVFGNLKSYVDGATSINYEIDPLQRRFGRLVSSTLNSRLIYNTNSQIIGQLDSTNKLQKRFVYATKKHSPDYYIDSSNNKFKMITDYLGSVRLVVSSTGTVSQLMEHDEFGRVLQDTSPAFTPFGFAGGLYDSSTGLVRFGARDYDPEIGRWLSKDPIHFNGGDTNLYGYVVADPVNLVDPSGLYATPEGPVDGGNAPTPPGSCKSFYGGKCNDDPGNYYCSIAPFLCENLLPTQENSDVSNCMRACLQTKEVGGPKNASCSDFVKHEADIHIDCALACKGAF